MAMAKGGWQGGQGAAPPFAERGAVKYHLTKSHFDWLGTTGWLPCAAARAAELPSIGLIKDVRNTCHNGCAVPTVPCSAVPAYA